MDGVQSVPVFSPDHSQGFRPVIGEFFLHYEGRCDLISLVDPFVLDEPVHLGTKADRFHHCCHDHMKDRILEDVLSVYPNGRSSYFPKDLLLTGNVK